MNFHLKQISFENSENLNLDKFSKVQRRKIHVLWTDDNMQSYRDYEVITKKLGKKTSTDAYAEAGNKATQVVLGITP